MSATPENDASSLRQEVQELRRRLAEAQAALTAAQTDPTPTGESGDPGHVVADTIRDLASREGMHAQLVTTERMASVGMLAAGVAHEINNPLSAVVVNLDLAARQLAALGRATPLREELAEIEQEIQGARDAAERVRQIVRDLRIFSRAEDGRRSVVDVTYVLESSARMAWNEIRHRARLAREYGPTPPVYANESRLGQLFLNLIVNAAQAIPEGHAEENLIRLTTGTEADGRVLVAVADSGAGIAPELLDRLFTPFFTTKPVGVGTGLGLAICRRIVTELDGEIVVESGAGQGSVFRVLLPPSPAAAPVEVHPAAAPVHAARRGRVLVVDDEPSVNAAIRRTLQVEHEVYAAQSGREALALLRSGARFDVILCDVMMPQMTGMDLHRELSAIAPDVAAQMIFLTAGAFTPAARRFLDEIPNLRVEKPFEPQQLRALVNERVR